MNLALTLSAVAYLVDFTIKVVALGVIPANRRPSTGMAWLLLILLIPGLGILAFLLIGRIQVGRKRMEWQARVTAEVEARTSDLPELGTWFEGPAYLSRVAHLNRALGALPVLPGNRVDLHSDYLGCLAAMTEEVDRATRFVHVEFYITAWDEVTTPFFEALVRAGERGVKVRLLLDHLGSRGIPGWKQLQQRLDDAPIEWFPMLPIRPFRGQFRRPDLRNHRKILVVDGTVAFSGSLNLVERGYNKPKNHQAGREWVELMSRIEGPLVTALDVLFATDWLSESGERLDEELAVLAPMAGDVPGQVIPSGPGIPTENNLRLFTTLVYGAQERISITSPYFVPDESLLYAVTTAAKRGVAVELFVSAVGDQFMVHHAQRSYYEALLRAGVRIHRYPAPYVLHSKHFTIDDDVAVLGSSNMDMRSFALNYEVSVMLLGEETVTAMRAVEDTYRSLSTELTLEEWLGRSRRSQYVDNVMRLTAALQ